MTDQAENYLQLNFVSTYPITFTGNTSGRDLLGPVYTFNYYSTFAPDVL